MQECMNSNVLPLHTLPEVLTYFENKSYYLNYCFSWTVFDVHVYHLSYAPWLFEIKFETIHINFLID